MDTSTIYEVAPVTAPQFALKELQVKLFASVAVGATGAVVPTVIVLEFKLTEQPLLALTRKKYVIPVVKPVTFKVVTLPTLFKLL